MRGRQAGRAADRAKCRTACSCRGGPGAVPAASPGPGASAAPPLPAPPRRPPRPAARAPRRGSRRPPAPPRRRLPCLRVRPPPSPAACPADSPSSSFVCLQQHSLPLRVCFRIVQGRAMILPRGRGDLIDAQWTLLEPFLPQGIKPGRPPVHSKRQLINGIRFRTCMGIPWRDLPERYGPWETVYGLFRRWQRDGTWHRIFEQLQARADAKGLITWDISVDSTMPAPTSTRLGPAKGGSAGRAARRRLRRALRPRTRTLARRADHQDPPGGRAGPEAYVACDHGGSTR